MKKIPETRPDGEAREALKTGVLWDFLFKIDGLSLFKEGFGQTYTYDKDNNVIAVTDLQNQKLVAIAGSSVYPTNTRIPERTSSAFQVR